MSGDWSFWLREHKSTLLAFAGFVANALLGLPVFPSLLAAFAVTLWPGLGATTVLTGRGENIDGSPL